MKAKQKEMVGEEIMRRESFIQQTSGEREAVERWENEGGKFRHQPGWKAKVIKKNLRKKKKAIFGLINSNEMRKLLRRRDLAAPVPMFT